MVLGEGPLAPLVFEVIFLFTTETLPEEERRGSLGVRTGVLVFANDPPLIKLEPGRSPNLGKLNWNSLRPVGSSRPCERAVGDVRAPGPLSDSLFLYSLTSILKRSTSARSRPFS